MTDTLVYGEPVGNTGRLRWLIRPAPGAPTGRAGVQVVKVLQLEVYVVYDDGKGIRTEWRDVPTVEET